MKTKMIIQLITGVVLVALLGCNTTSDLNINSIKRPVAFPQDYFGIYKGVLHIKNSRGTQEVDMEYHLLPSQEPDKYIYKLVYDGNARDYTLITQDAVKGVYAVDENNGIILPTYLNNHALHSFFSVSGNLLTSRAEFFQDHMTFEILFAPLEGHETGGKDDIPVVTGYDITTFQKAVLIKSKSK